MCVVQRTVASDRANYVCTASRNVSGQLVRDSGVILVRIKGEKQQAVAFEFLQDDNTMSFIISAITINCHS